MKVAQQPRTATQRGPVKPEKALDLPSRLAYLYAPILPYLKWIKITRKGPRGHGTKDEILTDLPGRGDHQANYPVVGLDGKLYFGVGSATNTGIVGADNFAYEWLPKFPQFHDVPAQDIRLAGRNYAYQNVLGEVT